MKLHSPGIQTSTTTIIPWDNFSKSLDAGVKDCTPPCLSCDYLAGALPYQTQLNTARGKSRAGKRKICTTTHLCRAAIGTNRMAPRWVLQSASGHPSKTPSQAFHFSINCSAAAPLTEIVYSASAACSNLSDRVAAHCTGTIWAAWRRACFMPFVCRGWWGPPRSGLQDEFSQNWFGSVELLLGSPLIARVCTM